MINAVEEKEAPEVVILKTVAAPTYIGHSIPEDFLKKAGLLDDSQDDGPNVKPLYKLHNGTIRGRSYINSMEIMLISNL